MENKKPIKLGEIFEELRNGDTTNLEILQSLLESVGYRLAKTESEQPLNPRTAHAADPRKSSPL